MSTINRLSSVDVLQPGDLMPIWDGSNGDTRKASMTTLLAYISANFADPDYTTRIVAPAASGWNVDVGDTGTSMWLIINPVADYALGSISLPPATSAADGQEITVSITQKVTAFSATSSGATVTGLPATLLSYAVFILRYNAEKLTWYAVEGANSVSSLVSYTPSGTGGVATDVETELNRQARSPESFGCVADGDEGSPTDNSVNMQKALTWLGTNSGVLDLEGGGAYYHSVGLTLDGDNFTLNANNATLVTDQDVVGLKIGSLGAGNLVRKCSIYGTLNIKNTVPTSSTKAAWLIQQMYESEIHWSADGYQEAMTLTGDAGGCVYNDFYLGHIRDCFYGVQLKPYLLSWVNENSFHGGRFDNPGVRTLGWHVYMPETDGTYGSPNNNRFYGPSFEASVGATMAGYYLDGGSGNTLLWPRYESMGTITDAAIKLTEDSLGCAILHPYFAYAGPNALGVRNIEDLGVSNMVLAIDKLQWSVRNNGVADTVLDLFRPSPNNNNKAMSHLRDYYNSSQDAQVYKSTVNRKTAGGYHYTGEAFGTLVTGTDGRDYHCILAHTSAAANEPGVGANWGTYWEKLPSTEAEGSAWATSTAYTGPATHFRVDALGKIWTNQASDNANTPSGATAKMIRIYDADGAPLGYIPIYAAAW